MNFGRIEYSKELYTLKFYSMTFKGKLYPKGQNILEYSMVFQRAILSYVYSMYFERKQNVP